MDGEAPYLFDTKDRSVRHDVEKKKGNIHFLKDKLSMKDNDVDTGKAPGVQSRSLGHGYSCAE